MGGRPASPDSAELATTAWLRRARWAVAAAALICVAAGLIWVYRAALVGDVMGAASGAAICLGVIVLDYCAAGVLRLGGKVLRNTRRLDETQRRLEELARSVDAGNEAAFVAAVGRENVEALVAARLDRDAFPRLVSFDRGHPVTQQSPAEPKDRSAPTADADSAPAESVDPTDSAANPEPVADEDALEAGDAELERLVHKEMLRLRDEFGQFVRAGDYASALTTGDRIVALFPDSPLAADFRAIRMHLQRRLPKNKSAERITAG
ncbi:MAG: hypothetical protein GY778_11765 [bacterium]|nr:hypothetical protein [bacterium]